MNNLDVKQLSTQTLTIFISLREGLGHLKLASLQRTPFVLVVLSSTLAVQSIRISRTMSIQTLPMKNGRS